jgi:hypothetical protein
VLIRKACLQIFQCAWQVRGHLQKWLGEFLVLSSALWLYSVSAAAVTAAAGAVIGSLYVSFKHEQQVFQQPQRMRNF